MTKAFIIRILVFPFLVNGQIDTLEQSVAKSYKDYSINDSLTLSVCSCDNNISVCIIPSNPRNSSCGPYKVKIEKDKRAPIGYFCNGKIQCGLLFIYDIEGILVKIERYKNGTFVGDGIIPFDDD